MIKNEVNSLDRIAAAVEALAENQESEQTTEPSSGTSGGALVVEVTVVPGTGPVLQKKASEIYEALCSGKIVYLFEYSDGVPSDGFMITMFGYDGASLRLTDSGGSSFIANSGDDYPAYINAGDVPNLPGDDSGGGSQSMS